MRDSVFSQVRWEVPDKFQNDLKPVRTIIENVDSDHVGLEGLALMSAVCDASNRSLLAIGVSGTGKSTVAFWVRDSVKRSYIMPHGITVNGLKDYSERLSNNSVSVIVEDLSRSGTDYMQVATVSVLAGLAYTGYISKHNQSLHLDISGCKMSALIYAQPLILKKLVAVNEFESDIKDKCLRFYHLIKPVDPKPTGLHTSQKWKSIDREEVKKSGVDEEIVSNLRAEVSKARAYEHCEALLKGSAVVNDRRVVTEADRWLVRRLTKNFNIENTIYYKEHLEGARELDVDLLPLFTMLLTYPKVTIKSIAEEYGGLSTSRTKHILSELGKWVLLNSDTIHPTKELIELWKRSVP